MDKEWQLGRKANQPGVSPRTILIAAGVVVLIILFVFAGMWLAGGAEEQTVDVDALTTRLQQQDQQIATLTAERDALKAQPPAPGTQDTAELDRLLAICSRDVNEGKRALESCLEENEGTADTIADAGRRLCCIARVSDPDINAYDVKGDRIVCVSSGGTAISC